MKRRNAFAEILAGTALLVAAGTETDAAGTNDATKPLPKFSHPLEITNVYLPLARLQQDVLAGKKAKKAVRLERTARPDLHKSYQVGDQTVEALVVEDRDYEEGELVEVTLDYFAQADDGTVYYLGEDVDEYERGKIVGHSGAWLFGKDTQQLGVAMPAHPQVGDKFRSEDVPKITREDDEVVSTSETVTLPMGSYRNCLKIKAVLSDGDVEYAYYLPDVGCVKEVPKDGELLLTSHETRKLRDKPGAKLPTSHPRHICALTGQTHRRNR